MTRNKLPLILSLILLAIISITTACVVIEVMNEKTFEDYVEMDVQGKSIDCKSVTKTFHTIPSDTRDERLRLFEHEMVSGIQIKQCEMHSQAQLYSRCRDIFNRSAISINDLEEGGQYAYCQPYHTEWVNSVTIDSEWETLFVGQMIESGLGYYYSKNSKDNTQDLLSLSSITQVSANDHVSASDKENALDAIYDVVITFNNVGRRELYYYFFNDSTERDKFVAKISESLNTKPSKSDKDAVL